MALAQNPIELIKYTPAQVNDVSSNKASET